MGLKTLLYIYGVFVIFSLSWKLSVSIRHNAGINDKEEQKDRLEEKRIECLRLIAAEENNISYSSSNTTEGSELISSGNKSNTDVSGEEKYCKRTWDDVICWPPARAGELAILPCPGYVHGVLTSGNVSKQCMEDGTWFYKSDTETFWTNFSECVKDHTTPTSIDVDVVPENIKEHLQSVKLMYSIGYGLSLASLVIAVFIMSYFKKLHCARNAIHVNLFISFILRAAVSFIKESLLVQSLGFPGDLEYDEHGGIKFRKTGSHWECRLFFTVYNYVIAANYIWIFVEAIYLQMLISVSVFVEKSRTKWYMLFGWTFPLTFIIPWVFVRIFVYNDYCWNINNDNKNMYIIYGPITASVIIQFLIFINIVRILFTKLHASSSYQTNSFRYRRLAKSTLILIPLFGVYYIIYSITSFGYVDEKSVMFLVLWWSEMFFNSFQGFILAMLFCFLNAEVQAEFKKMWRRHLLQRDGSTRFFSRASRASVKKSETCVVNHKNCETLSPLTEPIGEISNENLSNSGVQNGFNVKDSSVDDEETRACINNNQETVGLQL